MGLKTKFLAVGFAWGLLGTCAFFYSENLRLQSVTFVPERICNYSFSHKPFPRTSLGFIDKSFAPVIELFRKKAMNQLVPELTRFRSGSIPKVLLYSNPLNIKYFNALLRHVNGGRCPLPCKVTYNIKERNSADAILIHLRGAKNSRTVTKDLWPRDCHQPWIMYTVEPPPISNSVHKTKYEDFNGLFNRTMTYRRDSDVILNHGFVVTKEDSRLLPKHWVVRPEMKVKLSRKLAVALISNCVARSNRLPYIRKVQKYAQVDIYGRCGRLKCGESMFVGQRYNSTTNICLKIAGQGYLFFFAFENNLCKEYVTEKAYNLLHYPIIPVVRGSADYSSVLPPHSYINANDYSPKELAERLLYLKDHPKEYGEYFEWKKYYQPSTIGGVTIMCHLCSRLYEREFYEHKVYDDFEDWFVSKANCLTGIQY